MKGRLFEQKGACGLHAMYSFAFPVLLLKTGEGEQSICLSLLAKGKSYKFKKSYKVVGGGKDAKESMEESVHSTLVLCRLQTL